MQILSTHLSNNTIDFWEVDYISPTGTFMGQKKNGITQHPRDLIDQNIITPILGMVQSLNISVASVLILSEAQRQCAGMYQRIDSHLNNAEQQQWLFEGGYPVLANIAISKRFPYPKIKVKGDVVADKTWWAAIPASVKK